METLLAGRSQRQRGVNDAKPHNVLGLMHKASRRKNSVDVHALTVRPAPLYDNFLSALICEDANGTPLSVLSALTRLHMDPWKEASRLSAMPEATAQRTLVSTLGLVPGK